jgi:hypothetical protein
LNWPSDTLALTVLDQSGIVYPLSTFFAVCTTMLISLHSWFGQLDLLQVLQRYKEEQIKSVSVNVTSTRNLG